MKINFIIPVCNEEKNLEKCIRSLNEAIEDLSYKIKTFICINGCTDNTKSVANKCLKKYKKLNMKVLESKKGKINAQEKCIEHCEDNSILFFVDADVEVDKKAIKILLEEFEKHKELIAVGAYPVAKRYKGKNLWKKFLDEILNIRSRHPRSEISFCDVKEYHPYAISDPQFINTNPYHELKSKIFFHGRLFGLRSKKYWKKPKSDLIVGDDSFIPDYINYKYGKGRIRIRYDALVYYKPFITLKKHFKTYKRIFLDLKNLEKFYPEFKEIRKKSKLILDMYYIKKQNFSLQIKFFIYSLIRNIERILFKLSSNKDPKKLWK